MCALSNSLISIWLWKKTKPSNISTLAALEFLGSPYLSVRLSGGGPHLLYRYEENEREQKTESYSTREYVYSLDRYGRMGVRGGVIGISN
jgi:hypothetical protein